MGEITISQCYTVGLDWTNSRNGSEQCGVGSCWNMAGTEGKVRVQRTYQKYSESWGRGGGGGGGGGMCHLCPPPVLCRGVASSTPARRAASDCPL